MARKPKRDLTVDEQLARGPMDLPFLMLVLLLLGIGLIMMFSASYATAYYHDGDPLLYIARQAWEWWPCMWSPKSTTRPSGGWPPSRWWGLSSCCCWSTPPWAWSATAPAGG